MTGMARFDIHGHGGLEGRRGVAFAAPAVCTLPFLPLACLAGVTVW